MTILDRGETTHTINFVSRSYDKTGATSYRVIVRNKEENKEIFNQTVNTFSEVGYYKTYTASFGFNTAKDFTYSLQIIDETTSKSIYKEILLVTDQTAATYSVNSGKYTFETSSTNDYLIYE